MNLPGYKLGKRTHVERHCEFLNAWHLDDGHLATVQVFSPRLNANKSFRTQFHNITEFLRDKTFGVITPVRSSGVYDDRCCVIHDYFPGFEQAARAMPRYPVHELLISGLKLAATLTQLHKNGLVHGSVENGSIALQDNNHAMLGPIALQRLLPSLRSEALAGLSVSQRRYLAPEAEHALTSATDFYALGVALYRLLFGQPPFAADDPAELRRQKLAGAPPLPDGELRILQPLFDRLLNTDPNRRISNLLHFRQCLLDCGVSLQPNRDPVRPLADTILTRAVDHAGPPVERPAPEPRRHHVLRPLAPLAMLPLALAAYWIWPSGPASSRPTPVPEERSAAPATAVTAKASKRTEMVDLQRAEMLYKEAQQHFRDRSLGSALMATNNALKEDPGHSGATILKNTVIRELELQPLVKRARQQLEAGRLVDPAGDNALESYRQLALLLPADDARAQQGMQAIARKYLEQADQEFANQRLNAAAQSVERGLAIVPEFASLLDLQAAIDSQQRQRTRQAEQQRLEAERQLAERRRSEALARVRREKEAQQLALQRQQQEQQALARQREERLRRIEENRDKVNRLLTSARSYLVSNRLNLHTINVAREDYVEAHRLAEDQDQRVALLGRDIIQAYVDLAQTRINNYSYDIAEQALAQALTIDRSDPQLVLLKQEIDALRAISNPGATGPRGSPSEG